MNETLPEQIEGFQNPYRNVEEDKKTRMTCDILTDDYNFIVCMRPGRGTVAAIIGTMWKKTVDWCRANDVTDFASHKDLEDFVRDCVLITKEEYNALRNISIPITKPKHGRKTK